MARIRAEGHPLDVAFGDMGDILNSNLHDYLPPSIGDAHEIISVAVPRGDDASSLGATA